MSEEPEAERVKPRQPKNYKSIRSDYRNSNLDLILKALVKALEEWKEEGLEYHLDLEGENPKISDSNCAYTQNGTLKLGNCVYKITLFHYASIPDPNIAKTLSEGPFRARNQIITLEELVSYSDNEVPKLNMTYAVYVGGKATQEDIRRFKDWKYVVFTSDGDQPFIGFEQFLYEHIIDPDKPKVRQRLPENHSPAPPYSTGRGSRFVPRVVKPPK